MTGMCRRGGRRRGGAGAARQVKQQHDAEVFFEETFSDDYEERWVQSTHKGDEAGKFVLTAGKFYGDAEKDKGIQTSQDAKFYALSSEFKPLSNK